MQKDTEACPFRHIAYAFSYSTRGGAKVCEEPPSQLDTCIEEDKMVFQFQACPDVPGSERTGKDLDKYFTDRATVYGTFMSPFLGLALPNGLLDRRLSQREKR